MRHILLASIVLLLSQLGVLKADSPGTRITPKSVTHSLGGKDSTVTFWIDVSEYRGTNAVWVVMQTKGRKPFTKPEVAAQLLIRDEKETHFYGQLSPTTHTAFEGSHFTFNISDSFVSKATVYLVLPVDKKEVSDELGGFYFAVDDFTKS